MTPDFMGSPDDYKFDLFWTVVRNVKERMKAGQGNKLFTYTRYGENDWPPKQWIDMAMKEGVEVVKTVLPVKPTSPCEKCTELYERGIKPLTDTDTVLQWTLEVDAHLKQTGHNVYETILIMAEAKDD